MKYMLDEEGRDDLPFTFINDFKQWSTINDSIMGGNSFAICSPQHYGLALEGNLVEEGGGFVSCRSPLFTPPLDLSKYRGLNISVDGEGRTLKIALYCDTSKFILNELFYSGLHWVLELPTASQGTTNINLPFKNFKPTIRAKKIPIPVNLNLNSINQVQLLHSKFGRPGELNSGFRQGPIKILLRSINGFN